MKAHIIENGKVVNTITVESLDFMPNLVDANIGGAIGDMYDGQTFTPPPPVVEVPEVVTMAQARKALIISGVWIDDVDAAIASIADPTQKALARTDWEYSTTVRRDSDLIASLAPALYLTNDQIDTMFILAATL